MWYLASLWGNTFPIVFSTCANYASLFIQWIASLPILIPRAFALFFYAFLNPRYDRLTIPEADIGREVLRKDHDNDNEAEIARNSLNRPTNFLVLPPHLHIVSITQAETLKPSTTGTLFCFFAHHKISNRSLCDTHQTQVVIIQLLHASTSNSLRSHCLLRQHGGQTSSTHAESSTGALKRKASSASIRKSEPRRTNNKSRKNNDGDDQGNNNNRSPNPHAHGDNASADPEPVKYFACPFFKLSPRKHHRCVSKQLKDVDKVKQHIKRNHCSAALPCSRCWMEFKDDQPGQQALREHLNNMQCVESQGPDTLYTGDNIDGLLNTERAAPDEEKWYQIWRKMFEGHDAPDSPYLDLNIVEGVERLTRNEYQSRILAMLPSLSSRFRDQVDPDITTRIVNTLVIEGFSHPALFNACYRRIFRPAVPQSPSMYLPPSSPEEEPVTPATQRPPVDDEYEYGFPWAPNGTF